MFMGFPEETIRFFLDIRFHNETSFFKAHEDEFRENVKAPFFEFIEELGPTMLTIAPDFDVRPGKCLSRLHRDTRFSKDKSPYRDHLWLTFHRSGEAKDTSVMYWFELGSEWVEWGLGFWGQNRPAMDALRRRMIGKPQEVMKALRQAKVPDQDLLLLGDRYQRMKPPDGLPAKLAMLYPAKDFYVKRVNVPFAVCYQRELLEMVKQDYVRLKPLYVLLRSVADEGMAQLDP
ncbi:MAG: DUF2461 domain-containing protein [Eubacteriales bacterium]|nr:DUF2461 domain-containing protein [Eubacteriales bacterium]